MIDKSKKNGHMAPASEDGTKVPGWTKEIGDRISLAIEKIGGLKKAAIVAGTSDETLANWRDGRTRPTFFGMAALVNAAERDLNWMFGGEGKTQSISMGSRPEIPVAPDDFVLIPRYDVEASGGHGRFNDIERVVDYMAFKEEWIRRALRVDPRKLVLITAVGDSMEPTIRAGDLLLVDTGVEAFQDDAIYILIRNGAVFVKRVQHWADGSVTIKSDNSTAYDPETLSPALAAEAMVAGRVRWIGRLC